MGALQRFLETGFDIFGAVSRQKGGAERFVQTIRQREQAMADLLFDADSHCGEVKLLQILGQAGAATGAGVHAVSAAQGRRSSDGEPG